MEFEDVTFSYVPEKTVLRDISLVAKPGQKIALVGSTGAGKTTITNLINRFYDIEEGKIRYDNINIKKIKKPDLRRSLGMVLQDTHLFTGTVRDNIRYGNLDATDEEVENAARLANADHFIRHLPQGYDTMISGDGANLSQGQRQLLSIARAAVADPPVLILDEATSSIDTRTEKLIEKGMDSLMKGRTVFIIAHRLSTVRNADVILVLEHGEIIERGNHEQSWCSRTFVYAPLPDSGSFAHFIEISPSLVRALFGFFLSLHPNLALTLLTPKKFPSCSSTLFQAVRHKFVPAQPRPLLSQCVPISGTSSMTERL